MYTSSCQTKEFSKKLARIIITDGLASYRAEYKPIKDQIAHIANVGLRNKEMGNHRAERLHNSMREREKVMRHLKKAWSAEKVFKGFRAYYNFIRPHMALEDHTPAEIAAVPIQLGTNKWLDLIRQAARQTSKATRSLPV